MSEPAKSGIDPVRQNDLLVAMLNLTAVIFVIAGVALGILIDPLLFVVVLVGISDFVIARLFAAGKVGPLAGLKQAEQSGDAAQVAEADPSFNPYARED